MGRKPAHWTRVDRVYEQIRIDMQTLFTDLTIETPLAAWPLEDPARTSHSTSVNKLSKGDPQAAW